MGTVRRLFVALAVVGVATASLGADAHGFNAASASLTMSSPSGDYIGGGQNYSYTTANNDAFTAGGSPAFVEVSLLSHSGDWWTLDFAAPSGGALTPNTTYDNANRYPFQGTGPGLSVDGEGRGCNTLTGSFKVIDISFGPNNYLKTFHATFSQSCEGFMPPLTGEVQATNPPPPPALAISATINRNGGVSRTSGAAVVQGTVTCTKPVTVNLQGTVDQRANRNTVSSGSFFQQVNCGTTPVSWTATVPSASGVPFNPGKASVTASLSGYDTDYNQNAYANSSAVVNLTRR